MVLTFLAVAPLAALLLLYLGRFICVASDGRIFGAWPLMSRKPGRAEMIFCYMALLYILISTIVNQLAKAGAL